MNIRGARPQAHVYVWSSNCICNCTDAVHTNSLGGCHYVTIPRVVIVLSYIYIMQTIKLQFILDTTYLHETCVDTDRDKTPEVHMSNKL